MRKTISLVLAVLMMLVLLPAVKLNSAVADATTVTDTLTRAVTGVSGSNYASWTYTSEASGASYAGQSAGGNDSIQLRSKNNNSGIVTTASNGKATKIVVDWNTNTYGTRVLNVYGSNTAYTSPEDLYGDNAGTLIGSLTYVQNESAATTIDIADDYAFIALRSNADALYLNSVEITWEAAGSDEPTPDPTVVPDPTATPDPTAAPDTTAMELVNELADGDEVVIYYPADSKVMTGEDYFYNNKKHELVSANATLTDGVLAVPAEALLLTVVKTTGEDGITRYTFKTADGKFLEADGTNVQLADAEGANTLFQLEAVDGGFYIMCDTAQYNGKAQYIEYYKGYFTVYSMGTDTAIYTYQFYAKPAEEPTPEPTAEPTGDTIILFTNDVHCGIRDGWGYAGLADLKKTLEAEGNEVILVDAGDHVQGGPIGSLTQGEAIIDIMNFVGYDIATLGNHEFDYGMDQMFALVEQAKYPYVSANFVKVEGNEPVLDAYKIIEANGKKIAFVGISTPESITKSTPTYFMNEDNTAYVYGFCQDATGEGVYTAVQNAIDAAKAEGADYVILVGHMGIDEQSSPWMSTEVIANITGADAFIDGHSHSVINEVVEDKNEGGKGVLHGQTGTKLANIGKLTIDAEGGLTMEILPASEKVKDDPETDAYIKTIEDEFNALLNTVVAHTDHLLTVNDAEGNRAVRKQETNLGDLCADAYRYMFDSDIAFVNGGGVRADIAAGDITFQQIINVHPFGNTAVLAEVTGQQILDALEMGSRVCPTENGGFLQVAGMKYEIHTYVEPNCVVGSDKMWAGPVDANGEYRVKNVQILNKETGKYEPLDLTKKYTLASHNYMLKDMGDGFAMFGPNITILEDSGKLDNQVLIDYIQSMPEVDGVHQVEGYVAPEGEGRITIYEEAPAEPTGDTIILFTNDVHCGIRDGWGYAGLADLKKTLEAEGNEVILVDAGDHVQGGPIGSLTQGEAIIDIMNFVGYDIATLGNHEFDYGMDQMFALVEQAKYPYVSANFVKVEGNEPVLDAYKIIEANGKKIAFVGISTPESITKSTPTYFMNEDNTAYVYGFCQDATGEGVYTAVQNAIDAAKAEGADYVILVGHMGIDEQSSPWMSTEVIANITGADAFIDGHSHSVINEVVEDKNEGGKGVLHGQTGTKLANIGKLTIDAEGGLTMEILPASEKVKDDPETDAYIKTIEDEFNALLNTVVAHTDHLLTVNDAEGNRAVRKQETNLGDLCADAYRYMFDSDIAFVNGGGVRADIAAGDITFQQIINVHPFGNTAVLAEVTGQQILDALEMGSRVCPTENGGFLQVAGMKYEIHTYVEPNCVVGSDKMWAGPVDANGEYRVKNVQILNKETGKYEPLDLTKKYTLASHNYMLKDMGDGFAMFGPNITILEDSGKLDNQVLIDYIQSMPEVDGVHQVEGYVAPEGEGRITIVPEQIAKIYGEDVKSGEVTEVVDGKELYRYDIKLADVPADTEVVGIQTYVEFDSSVLKFVEAKSALEGSTGINAAGNKLLFAWAANGEGIHPEDGTVIVSLYFELAKVVADGYKTEIKFTTNAQGGKSGFSYAADGTVVEAKNVETVDGSITFEMPSELTLYAEAYDAADVKVEEDGEVLYRYDIKVKDLPEAGVQLSGAQIFLTYDKDVLECRKADGKVEWQITDKGTKLMLVWASDTAVELKNGDVVASVYFATPSRVPFGTTVDVAFTTNVLGDGSSISFLVAGKVLDIEATTVDGSITFNGLYGDANCDGEVTSADAAAILRALVGLEELSAQGAINADVDGDGEVTAADASAILRYLVQLIEKFPVEEEQP